jgi:exportin-2 (importin alpha re-exporter)
VNIGLLQTVHSIFKRWRTAFEGNAVLTEIQFALTEFAPAYLEFFKAINALVDQNDANLPVLLEIVFLLVKIFHSLNCQDLPEFFEDNMPEFMSYFKKYLEYQNPALPVDPYEAGVLEKIKTAICEVIDIYANKYEAEFKQLPQFVETIWTLLTSTNDEQRFDMLVSKAMSFLTAVVKHERHRSLFENENVLNSICTQIILPNMALRGLFLFKF